MKFSISRYGPDRDERPYRQDFHIVLNDSDHIPLDGSARNALRRERSAVAFDSHQAARPTLHPAVLASGRRRY